MLRVGTPDSINSNGAMPNVSLRDGCMAKSKPLANPVRSSMRPMKLNLCLEFLSMYFFDAESSGGVQVNEQCKDPKSGLFLSMMDRASSRSGIPLDCLGVATMSTFRGNVFESLGCLFISSSSVKPSV